MAGLVMAMVLFDDQSAYENYVRAVAPTITAYGGRPTAYGHPVEILEGDPGQITYGVVLEFDTVDAARAWWRSPEYAAVRPLRTEHGASTVLLLESAPVN